MTTPTSITASAAANVNLATGLTFASLIASAPFGVPVSDMLIGTGFCILGVAGRAAFDMQRALEGTSAVPYGRIIGRFGAGIFGSLFTSVLVLVALKVFFGARPDTVVIIGLLAFGFGGPRMLSWAWGIIADKASKLLGISVISPIPPEGPNNDVHH